MQADWDRSKTGKSLITYGFLFGLLVLMVMMLAVTPMPGWMDESNDEVRLGGPNTKLDAAECAKADPLECERTARAKRIHHGATSLAMRHGKSDFALAALSSSKLRAKMLDRHKVGAFFQHGDKAVAVQ
ncbi:hypothetical protein T484DRAFT_2018443 [Baffinella frigidus]|nr:hypothetical protein T484DRAFT_2018443 [Cryptophyta sp. CCMP2293]